MRRIGHCRGFGIQSPTDFMFVREVVNEHWPYYAYTETGKDDNWLRKKMGQRAYETVRYTWNAANAADRMVQLIGISIAIPRRISFANQVGVVVLRPLIVIGKFVP